MKFNLNDYVYVQLSDKGFDMHRAFWEPFSNGNYCPPKVSACGLWSKFQMHELMHVFGPACWIGSNMPFVTTEIFLESDAPVFLAGGKDE